jgi:hypothetical protein
MMMNLLELLSFLCRIEIVIISISMRSFLYTHRWSMIYLIFFKNFVVSYHINEFGERLAL